MNACHIDGYTYTPLRQEIVIENLVTVHYFEYDRDFTFPGEVHNFWEFLYVDKGQVEVSAGYKTHILNQGDIIFHMPMEFHNLKAIAANVPNLVVVAFVCDSPAMGFFEHKILRADSEVRDLLGSIVQEATDAYSCALDDPDLRSLERQGNVPFGAEQIIRLSLELMLIHLIREDKTEAESTRLPSSIREKAEEDVFLRVVSYLERNICNRLTLDDVCRDNLFGRSYLQKVFREKTGGGVMEYFGKMKLEAAKREIREGDQNFTEIANQLGYASIHYFSRHFKKVMGMTPTEYASSIKVRADKQKDRPVFFYK